jgi:S1-C subfamily serine protease
VGHLVLAIGRPDTNGVETSLGIISAVSGPVRVGRGTVLEQYIRSSTIPYPGFSGGPLVNAQGEVLGLNTSGFSGGALVTIPAKIAWDAAASLASHGHIRRGFLGIRSQPVHLAPAQITALGRSQETGLLLITIEDGSPAASAGLQTGDILVGMDGHPITEHEQLQSYLNGDTIGRPLPVEILRGSARTQLDVTVGERE